jgi:hypothetical protein
VRLIVAALLLLPGCASTDWYAAGMKDGAHGAPAASGDERYLAGRREGLMIYCTEKRGFDAGRAGRPYGDVCPDEVAADYRDGYRRGSEERERSAPKKPL